MCEGREAVRGFLQDIKQTITTPVGNWGSWLLVKRKENMDCLTELGFNYQDVAEVILGLSVADYSGGPCRDRDMPGELWMFGKAIADKEIYIKLKLATFGTLKRVRIVSFHFAEEPLCYPYK